MTQRTSSLQLALTQETRVVQLITSSTLTHVVTAHVPSLEQPLTTSRWTTAILPSVKATRAPSLHITALTGVTAALSRHLMPMRSLELPMLATNLLADTQLAVSFLMELPTALNLQLIPIKCAHFTASNLTSLSLSTKSNFATMTAA